MKRHTFALLLFAASSFAASAPGERCSAHADVTGLPLIEVPAGPAGDRFAIMVTGDGGWRRIDRKITDRLHDAGIPMVGFLASDYFRARRTPDQAACALERVMRTYRVRWHRDKVILVGYSRGADVLPFMVSRLPDDLRGAVSVIALLGLERQIDFKYNPPWSIAGWFRREPQFPVRPEVEKLRGDNVVCVFGAKETDSLCRQLDPRAFTIVGAPGGHHFAGKYHDVADAILAKAR